MTGDLPDGDYFVYVSRADKRPPTGVWPIALSQPLPPIPIPLLPGDPDVNLDLQQALTDAFDAGRFRSVIDYRQPPDVALTAEQTAWAEQLLRAVETA